MKNTLGLLTAFLIGLGCANLSAQEAYEIEVADVQSEDGTATFGNAVILESTEDLGNGTASSSMRVIAAEPGQTMAFATDGGDIMHFGGMGTDSFSLLNNKSVQKDLELVGAQMDNIRAVQKEFSEKIREQMGDLSKGKFDPSRLAGLKDTIADIRDRQKEEINKLLLPHQQERLKQVALQMKMKGRGTASALTSGDLAETLGITEEQIEKLKTRSKELQKEIAEKTKQMRDDAKEELIGILSPTQQKKLKELIGDEYQPQADDWKSGLSERIKQRLQKARGGDDN